MKNILTSVFLIFSIILFSITDVKPQGTTPSLVEATKLLNEQDNVAAFEMFDQLINNGSSNADAYIGRGICYFRFSQYSQALDDMQKALSLETNNHIALFYCGNAYFKLNNDKTALEYYDKAIKANPSFADAFAQRAFLHRKMKHHEAALNDFNRAIELETNIAEVYYNRADILNKEYKKCETAIADYTRTIELEPTFAQAYFNRAMCREALKQFPQAASDIKAAIKLGLTDTLVYKKSATLNFLAENYNDAISDFSIIISKFKIRSITPYFYRGVSYNRTGQYDKAIKDLTATLMLERETADAYIERAFAYNMKQKTSTAFKDLLNAQQLDPKYDRVYKSRAEISMQIGKNDEAIADFDKAISLNDDADTYFKRGLCHLAMNNIPNACADFQKAFTLGSLKAKEKLNSICH